MSNKLRPRQYADARGTIVEDFDGNGLISMGTNVPADNTPGYSVGGIFAKRAGAAGAQLYMNQGTTAACAFKPMPDQTLDVLAIIGLAAGKKIAAGQATTVTASDTIATGLATVTSVIVSMESDPTDDPFMCTGQIGDQAGSPAAGSIIIKTWKNTGGTDPTPLAATTFSKKVNWIAFGT